MVGKGFKAARTLGLARAGDHSICLNFQQTFRPDGYLTYTELAMEIWMQSLLDMLANMSKSDCIHISIASSV